MIFFFRFRRFDFHTRSYRSALLITTPTPLLVKTSFNTVKKVERGGKREATLFVGIVTAIKGVSRFLTLESQISGI